MLVGEMEVLEDAASKEMICREGDKIRFLSGALTNKD